jgi:outer membrane receptor protein involved in Fe transport
MNMTNHKPMRIKAALAMSAAAPVLFAAQMAAAAATADNSTPVLTEVVVTAEKRSETLRHVPQSVSVVSGSALEKTQAFDFQDLAAHVPGLSITQPDAGDGRVILRGVNTSGVASTVAVYMDETPFGSSSGLANGGVLAADFDTFDIDRVEVLRGPQGTLYGASSLGGVLKYVTTAPKLDRWEFRGQAGGGAVDGGDPDWNVSGVINAPIGQKAALRVGGFYRRDGAFIDSIGTAGSLVQKNIDGAEVYGGRASLLIDPTSTFSLRLNALVQEVKDGAPVQIDADPETLQPLYGSLTQSQYFPQSSKVTYKVFNATANLDLGFADLVSATSYGLLDQFKVEDLTPIFGPLFTLFFSDPAHPLGAVTPKTISQRKWTEELRLTSHAGQKLEWLIGGYYTHETGLIAQDVNAFNLGSLTTPPGLPLLARLSINSKYEEFAGFANATLHLTDKLSVAAGGRYSHNQQHGEQVVDGALEGGLTVFPPVESHDDVFTYSVAPRYDITDHVSAYARVAKGFRPGGPNLLPPGAPADTPLTYGADTIMSYEGGLKADLFGRRMSLDVSAFYLDWQNIQLNAVINSIGINANGGTAVSKGVEFTITGRPVEGLTLSANGTFDSAHLTSDTPPIVGGFKGDRLPYAPKWALTLNGDYEHTLTGRLDGFAGATLAFVGAQSGDWDPGYQGVFGHRVNLPGYTRLDLRAGVRQDRWSVQAYVKNATNSLGVLFATPFGQVPNNALGITPTRPRTIGAEVRFDY